MPLGTLASASLLSVFLLLPCVGAQDCENYGFRNGSSCACPVGFGGSTCSQPACGGTIFQGSQRQLASKPTGPFANLTASDCSCQNDWTGLGCNVCQTSNACQSGYSAAVNSPSLIPGGGSNGPNDTIVCNTTPRVYAAGQMSCQVVNPTLQSLYPLNTYLNIFRTSQPSLTLLPNVTGFGQNGTIYAQLFYDGVEQFYCEADTCIQQAQNGTQGNTTWSCQNLQCTCRVGTSFCGGVPQTNLTTTIDHLGGTLEIDCQGVDSTNNSATCNFKQDVLTQVFGSSGLALQGCTFGECVRQSVIDNTTISNASGSGGSSLSGGVIAGLVVVGALVLFALLLLLLGLYKQRVVRKAGYIHDRGRGATLEWVNVSYIVPRATGLLAWMQHGKGDTSTDKTVLDSVSGKVQAGQMMAILGPSGAGKTTLVEILANKSKSAIIAGTVRVLFNNGSEAPRIGFVPQQDILPPTLTVFEALLFAARLRLPEGIPDEQKVKRVVEIMEKLGISHLNNVRIGYSGHVGGTRARGISGGEMRRLSIGLELIADPDILILDEPTSGLDSVSASRVANVLHSIAHDPTNPIPVIASIHQPSSQLYQKFDTILLLSHGRTLYCGPGSLSPADYFKSLRTERDISVPAYPAGYNVADYLLEVASDPPVGLFNCSPDLQLASPSKAASNESQGFSDPEKVNTDDATERILVGEDVQHARDTTLWAKISKLWKSDCMTTFLTQLQVISGREWKILQRDKTLFLTHVAVASILGVFCGGLYYKTGTSIAGFQSRIGCLFFLGALIAFSTLSALYNVVDVRPLFVRERSSSYYGPTAWLLSRFLFDVIPLRIIPTLIVSSITYWMGGLSPHAAHFFKFLFILVLYTLAMTLFNFLLGTFFYNGGIAILLSALTALYQMTFAGFFVHLNSIPPVLRWLQWLCPLKYTLEALSVNEVGSGLMIQDTIQGVPVNISASLIMQLLFGFGLKNYYRDVLVLFGFIAGFGLGVIAVVWWKVREKR